MFCRVTPEAGLRRARVGPFQAGVRALLRTVPALRPPVEKLLWRAFYELGSLATNETSRTMINYGYAEPDVEAGASEDQLGEALYVAVAGAAELSGKQVLEVGCGRGGGRRSCLSVSSRAP